MTKLEGSYIVEFEQLKAYIIHMKRTNTGSSCEIDLCKEKLKEGKRVFRRLFICFEALKKG